MIFNSDIEEIKKKRESLRDKYNCKKIVIGTSSLSFRFGKTYAYVTEQIDGRSLIFENKIDHFDLEEYISFKKKYLELITLRRNGLEKTDTDLSKKQQESYLKILDETKDYINNNVIAIDSINFVNFRNLILKKGTSKLDVVFKSYSEKPYLKLDSEIIETDYNNQSMVLYYKVWKDISENNKLHNLMVSLNEIQKNMGNLVGYESNNIQEIKDLIKNFLNSNPLQGTKVSCGLDSIMEDYKRVLTVKTLTNRKIVVYIESIYCDGTRYIEFSEEFIDIKEYNKNLEERLINILSIT